ncbi:MAG: hypothetical protein JWP01_1489 [Myxococcales bacterium]|nr:hypothetical protein [Myxococcales bacterium]
MWACVGLLAGCGNSGSSQDPGRVTLHRLNNVEYDNTMRDLLGTKLRLATDFPADDRGYGFDNVADVLRMSSLALELYETAAATLIADTLAVTTTSATQTFELMTSTSNGTAVGTGWLFFSNGSATLTANAPVAGTYRIAIRAYQHQAGTEPARLTIEVPNQPAVTIDVTALQAAPAEYETTWTLPAGNVLVTVSFINNDCCYPAGEDRNVWVDHLTVEGPLNGPVVDVDRRSAILICDQLEDRACQTSILTRFAARAWRRPPTVTEIERLLDLVSLAATEGDTPEGGLRLALQRVLVSPHFLFRVEIDPDPTSTTPHPLTDWELATRLSYFLWSSMPDEALFAAADAGTLTSDPNEIERQTRRMLEDPKAIALTDNFAGQWLFTRALGDQDPDYDLFPMYDDELESAMRAETRRYFQAFLMDDIPMNQFLVADFTYVNDRLAAHYGLPPVGSEEELVRVSLEGTERRGFLTQGSFLRVTSRPKRTSPVLRGKWVLDNLLCTPPRPPPPGVEGLPDAETTPGSVRDRLEAHRNNPICASCHRVMDPLGFALDNFDAIGSYRSSDSGFPIDASGELADGVAFDGAIEMTKLLAEDPGVYRCMVEKLYTYTGRSPFRIEATEHVDSLTERFIAGGYILRDLIVDMTTDPSFVSRRGEP